MITLTSVLRDMDFQELSHGCFKRALIGVHVASSLDDNHEAFRRESRQFRDRSKHSSDGIDTVA